MPITRQLKRLLMLIKTRLSLKKRIMNTIKMMNWFNPLKKMRKRLRKIKKKKRRRKRVRKSKRISDSLMLKKINMNKSWRRKREREIRKPSKKRKRRLRTTAMLARKSVGSLNTRH